MSTNINDACAIVFSQDGVHHVVCATPEQMLDAINRAVAAGDQPVVFTRKTPKPAPAVVNNATGPITGNLVQAHTVNGVRL